jgi:tetratricopeptide (TPR) repeat protein/transcriptional regulator with XRE-family HTH domain
MGIQKPSAFGELLRRYRVAAVLTQEELAARAGLSMRAVSDLERGIKSRPHAYTVRLLADALGLEGSVRAAFEAARGRGTGQAGAVSGLSGDGASPSQRGTSAAPIVGRTRELALLERHLSGAPEESLPPVLLLAGEPGIGKSRLIREAAQRAVTHGWRVLMGGCQRRNGHAPFAPLLEALEGYIAHRTPSELRTDLRGCAWLVRLLPELAARPIEPLPAWTLPPDQERRLMDKAVGLFLANVAGPAGTILLLDDLQWAGADALVLLATLVRAAPEPPLRVIGTYRDTEVGAHDTLAGALADLAHAGLARQHRLGPLPAEDARHLLGTLLDGWPEDAPAVQERVVQRAGGVPFYLVSYAQGLRSDAPEGNAAEVVPWDVAQGVRQRIAALPVPAQEVLGAAAVIGRVVPAGLLTSVAGPGEREVLAALDAASRARLLLDENQTYQFAHDLIREVVEADVGAARRLVLHRRIAEALEREPGEQAVEVLAYHYGRAGVPEKAVHYLEQAGDRAWAQHANAAAESHYREVVDGLDRLGQALASARVREKLGLVLHMAAQNERTLAVLEQAAEAYRVADDLDSQARITAQIGLVHQNTGRYEEVAVRLQMLARRLEERGPSRELVKLYAPLAGLLAAAGGHCSEALATTERAVELARILGDAQLLAEVLTQHGNAYVVMGCFVEARRALEEAIPLAEASGDLIESLPKALWLLSHVCLRSGELDRGMRCCERELVITERYGQEVRVVASIALRGLLAYVRGDWAQARRDGEQALAVSQHVGPSWISPFPLLVLGLVCYGEGRWQDAARYLEESVAVSLVGPLSWALFAPGVLAEIDLREGRPERARARLAPPIDAVDRDEADVSLILAPYAWSHVELGDVASAATIVDRGITRARAQNDRFTLVDALRVQAMVAIRQQQLDAAGAALEEGLALARSMPYPHAEARLLHVYGLLYVQRHEAAQAAHRLDTALAIYRRLGARRDAEQAEEALTVLQAHSG